MKKILSNKILEKIITKASSNLRVEEIKYNNSDFQRLKEYLNNQKFLDEKKINFLFKINSNLHNPIGIVIKNLKDEIVGFMGTLFYEKVINEKKLLFCNIHSWIVDKKYRLNSFFLIIPLLRKNYNLTAYTPIKSLEGLLEKFGLNKKILNFKIVININFTRIFIKKSFFIQTEQSIILDYLKDYELSEFKKYSPNEFYKFIIINKIDNKYIFVIAKKIRKKLINLFNFFYISDKNEFSNNWTHIKNLITNKFRVNFFSEYYFDNVDSVFPKKIWLYKVIKKNIDAKTSFKLDKLDIRNSDLLIS